MKRYFKIALFCLCLTTACIAAAQEKTDAGFIPGALRGVWESGGRMISFYEAGDSAMAVIFLKLFYGWYYDRTAEPLAESAAATQYGFPSLPARDRNDTTARAGEFLAVSFDETSPVTDASGSWAMRILYPPYREPDSIALAVINDGIYLNFYIRHDDASGSRDTIAGFWRAGGTASGITASKPYYATNIESLYITDGGDSVFRIRYWEANVEPDLTARAYFSDGASEYSVDKYLVIGDKTFTCVQGRGTRIRQITKSPLPKDYALSDDGALCAFGAPYLTKSGVTDIYAEAAEKNARTRPPQPPLFPPSDLDFHYEQIEELRKYTPNWIKGTGTGIKD
ncbi:MAG: hypothetical protein Pg6C_14940 [Treponemataceae bacterium]|nr:MAG: hypothetical protein Pg6C_14940 [Treponemataceae bacterium]